MNTISWEKDANGCSAIAKQSKDRKFISPSASASLVKGLMHEVINISASFSENDVIVFSRLAGISTMDEKSAAFYGLYVSSGIADGPNYCIRRCSWSRGFGSIEDVLKGFSAQTMFFDFNALPFELGEIVERVDSSSKDEYQIFSQPASDGRFIGKHICYFVADDLKDLSCTYSGKSSSSPSVEKLFDGLGIVFDFLSVEGAILPLVDSFRISYAFQHVAEVLTHE